MSETCLLTLRMNAREWDLEVPSALPSQKLVELLQTALSLPPSQPPLRLYIAPFNVALPGSQSLQEAGVLDGSILILSATSPESVQSDKDLLRDNPATGWKALQNEPAEAAPVEQPKPGYVWKKL